MEAQNERKRSGGTWSRYLDGQNSQSSSYQSPSATYKAAGNQPISLGVRKYSDASPKLRYDVFSINTNNVSSPPKLQRSSSRDYGRRSSKDFSVNMQSNYQSPFNIRKVLPVTPEQIKSNSKNDKNEFSMRNKSGSNASNSRGNSRSPLPPPRLTRQGSQTSLTSRPERKQSPSSFPTYVPSSSRHRSDRKESNSNFSSSLGTKKDSFTGLETYRARKTSDSYPASNVYHAPKLPPKPKSKMSRSSESNFLSVPSKKDVASQSEVKSKDNGSDSKELVSDEPSQNVKINSPVILKLREVSPISANSLEVNSPGKITIALKEARPSEVMEPLSKSQKKKQGVQDMKDGIIKADKKALASIINSPPSGTSHNTSISYGSDGESRTSGDSTCDDGSSPSGQLTITGSKSTEGEMDSLKTMRSMSLREKSEALTRKSVRSTRSSTDSSLPESSVALPAKAIERLKRDSNVSDVELTALRGILKKVDLFDDDVRKRWADILKGNMPIDKEIESPYVKVLKDAEVDSLKQKLFLSRKELDAYISFTKKMEREKRQSMSEKEELETKIQWHERRLKRFEDENKSLKTERATLLNQIYDLRGKSSKESAARQKNEASPNLNKQPEIESSKQRLIYEAEAFVQERTKLIKERQALDEELRNAQISRVSLLAQLQHSENTIKDLKAEKDQLKEKCAQMVKESHKMRQQEILSNTVDKSGGNRGSQDHCVLLKSIQDAEAELYTYQNDLKALENKYENLQAEFRNEKEARIELDHKNMALKDTVNVIQKAKEDADQRVKKIEEKYRETLSELSAITASSEEIELHRETLQQELEQVSSELSELQHEVVDMESDRETLITFLDKLSLELQEKLGEDHVSKDREAESLKEQAETILKQVAAHITPNRKLQDYEALKEEHDELQQELKELQYVLAHRMEVQTLTMKPMQKCECSKEKANMKRDLEDCQKRIDSLDDEVNRLHEDKQQLLMSFLNLQASKMSRDVRSSITVESENGSEDNDEDDFSGDSGSDQITLKKNVDFESSLLSSDDFSHFDRAQLQKHLQEVLKTKEKLESERVELLNSLCKQVEKVKELKGDVDGKSINSSKSGSRPGSFCARSDDLSSPTSSLPCVNCLNSSQEIRQYLNIIEELTEEKLRLENVLESTDADKAKLNIEVEKLTENVYDLEADYNALWKEKDKEVEGMKNECRFFQQKFENVMEASSVLEENVKKLNKEKDEILSNHKLVQDERFGFIRSLTQISEQKQNLETENKELKKQLEELKLKFKAVHKTLHASNLSKGGDDVKKSLKEPPKVAPRPLLKPENSSSIALSKRSLGRVSSNPDKRLCSALANTTDINVNIPEKDGANNTYTCEVITPATTSVNNAQTSSQLLEMKVTRGLSVPVGGHCDPNPEMGLHECRTSKHEITDTKIDQAKLSEQRNSAHSFSQIMDLFKSMNEKDGVPRSRAKTLSFEVSFKGIPVQSSE